MAQSEKKLRINYVILFLMGFIAGRFSIPLDTETNPVLTLQSELQKQEFYNSTGLGFFWSNQVFELYPNLFTNLK